MLEYVNVHQAQSKGRVTDPSFISIAQDVNKNHLRIRNRYLTSSLAVDPTNILLKILSGLNLHGGITLDTLHHHTDSVVNQLASALRLTSPVSYGEGVVNEIMEGGHTSILLVSNRFDMSVPWMDLEPIIFHYHTNTNINYKLGTGNSASYAAVSVNVYMLAYQLLHWSRWKSANNADESVRQFISKYPIFNSLRTYMDISQLNRHFYRLSDKEILDDPVNRDYPTPNIEHRVDKSNLKIVSGLLSGGRSVGQALYSTPVFYKDSALDLLKAPRVIRTDAVRWWNYATLLPLIQYGLTVADQSGYNSSQGVLSNLDRDLSSFINTRTLAKVPKHLSQHIMEEFIEPSRELIQRLR